MPRKATKKKKSKGINLMPFILVFGGLATILSIYIAIKAAQSEERLFSLAMLALFAGLLFESFIISSNWKVIIATFIGAYIFSLFAFLPGRNEVSYIFEKHLTIWPYFLIGAYAFITTILHEEKIIPKLTEGISLLLSISFIYWVLDYGTSLFENRFIATLVGIGFMLSLYAIFHGLSYIPLTRTSRLVLSIWSTLITFAFAIDHAFRVLKNPEIEKTPFFSEGIYISIQYFLLGVSAVYIIQNYLMLAIFIPSKNGQYFKDLKDGLNQHIKRFSQAQIKISHALLCIGYALIIYGTNHHFKLLPRHTMIWFVVISFPLIFNGLSSVIQRLFRPKQSGL
jgi:hypothetical protein